MRFAKTEVPTIVQPSMGQCNNIPNQQMQTLQCNNKDGKQERFIMSSEAIREFSQVKANSLPQVDKKGKVHNKNLAILKQSLNFKLGPGEKIELNKVMWNNIRKLDPESDLMHCFQLQDAATGKIKDCSNLKSYSLILYTYKLYRDGNTSSVISVINPEMLTSGLRNDEAR